MPSAVTTLRPTVATVIAVDATRHARRSSPRSRSSLKTGMKEAPSAASATSERTVFGMMLAAVNAFAATPAPSSRANTISRTRPRTRESPVAAA